MNFLIITILLVFPTLFSLSITSLSKTTTLCELSSQHKSDIISIFNLGEDLVIHTSHQLNYSKQYNFWRVYGTNRRPVIGGNADFSDRGTIDQRIRDRIYKMPKFGEQMDEMVANKTFNSHNIALQSNRSLYPIPVRKESWQHLNSKCAKIVGLNSSDENLRNKCNEFFSLFYSSGDLLCLYNRKFGNGLPAIYETPSRINVQDQGPEGEHLKPGPSIMLDEESCHESQYTISMAIIDDSDRIFNDIIFILNDFYGDITLKVLDLNTGLKSIPISVNTSQVYYLFKFNDYYKVLSCGKGCNFYSPLFMIWYKLNPWTNELEATVTPTDLTINRLIGCQKHYSAFDPHYFCHKPRIFQSILSFGTDVYFQQLGRFWRYNSHGFNKPKDNFGPKVVSIRLDSDITTLLEKEGIDTSYKVMSFYFNLGHIKACKANDMDCVKRLKQFELNYQVCIYGITNEPRDLKDLTSIIGLEFVYTPSGLKSIERIKSSQKPDKNEALNHCQDFVSDLDKNALTKISFPDKPIDTNKQLMLKSIAYTLPSTPAEKERGPHIWALYYNMSSKSIYGTLSYIKHSHDVIHEYPEIDQMAWYFELERTNLSMITPSIFVLKNKVYLYHNTRLVSLDAEYWRFYQHYELVGMNIKQNQWSNSTWPFHKMFNCPFNSSTSLVTVKRGLICPNNETTLAESVFVIGEHIYHQLGQHFYRFNEFNSWNFSYDKYVSDLFNDYFDTTHRVTGMSVPNTFFAANITQYDVVIHGKSHQNYRHIGEYIYVVFTIDTSEGPLLLRAERKPTHFTQKIFGVGGYKGADKFVEAMTIWSNDPEILKPTLVWISYYNYTENSALIDRKLWMYYTIDSKNFDFMFANKFSSEDWTKVSLGEIGSPDLPFQEIIGVHGFPTNHWEADGTKYQFKDTPLVLSARMKGQPIQVYFRDSGVENGIDFQKFKTHYSYSHVFCVVHQLKLGKSEQSSDSSQIKAIISVLIIIVLSLTLVMGLYSYRINQKQITKNIRTLEATKTSSKIST